MEQILGWIISGGVAAAFIKILDNIIVWKLNRKAAQADKAAQDEDKKAQEKEEEFEAMKSSVRDLAVGQKVILHDRIKYLGRGYLRSGEVDLDDRHDLIEMHEAYHSLGGNGNLDALMEEILELPLKRG